MQDAKRSHIHLEDLPLIRRAKLHSNAQLRITLPDWVQFLAHVLLHHRRLASHPTSAPLCIKLT
jgi:hypothetical protein